ncbi:MAG: Cyclic pyranopterin monophosphate synthase accessory protein, partial [uncultured Ramlibacter sp.]
WWTWQGRPRRTGLPWRAAGSKCYPGR